MKKKLKDEDLKKVDGGSTVITVIDQTLKNTSKGSHTIGGAKPSKVTVTKKSSKKK